MEFILKIWLYLAFAMDGAIGIYLWTNRTKISKRKIIAGLTVMVFPLHMFEERIFPGGFHYIYGQMANMVQTQLVVFVCNVIVLGVLAWLFIKKGDKAWCVMLLSLLGLAEFFLHVAMAVKSYTMYHSIGLAIPYSPGWLTTIIFFLPLAILGFRDVLKAKEMNWKNIGKMVLGMVLIAWGTILLPNILFNNSPFPFEGYGFYEVFL